MKRQALSILLAGLTAASTLSMSVPTFAAEPASQETETVAEASTAEEAVVVSADDEAVASLSTPEADTTAEAATTAETEAAGETLDAAATSTTAATEDAADKKEAPVYVLMNIPYSEFYASDNLSADVVSSATKNKSRSPRVLGSYHVNSDGSQIDGITFPVKVTDPSVLDDLVQVTDADTFSITVELHGKPATNYYNGKAALFERPDHAYYLLADEPSFYKELTVDANGNFHFGEIKNAQTTNVTLTAKLKSGDDTNRGDYQINVNLEDATKPGVVYGAIMHTSDHHNYALRHLENIWNNDAKTYCEFAIDTGHKQTVKGSPLHYANYVSAEGKTVTGFTLYTDTGIVELTLSNPVRLTPFMSDEAAEKISIEAAQTGDSLTFKNLPSDIQNPSVTIEYEYTDESGEKDDADLVEKAAITDGKLALDADHLLKAGVEYTAYLYSDNYATTAVEFTYAPEAVYVLMNIPYSEFFAADEVAADVVSSATKTKTRSNLAAGSYHDKTDGSEITGVTYPVKVDDPTILKGLKEVTDKDSYSITVKLRGKDTTTEYKGADALFENDTHAYYLLSAEPDHYLELTAAKDNKFTFITAKTGTVTEYKDAEATLDTGSEAYHTDYQINITDYSPEKTYGAILHTTDAAGKTKDYGLRHVANIWRNGEFGFDVSDSKFADIEGKSITGLTVFTDAGEDEITLKTAVYVKPFASGDALTARSTDGSDVVVKNIPTDVQNATISVYYWQGEGHNAKQVFVNDWEDKALTAEDVAAGTKKISLSGVTLLPGTEYTVELKSDNYASTTATFVYPVAFTDVADDAYYKDAVAWAYYNGVTSGTSTDGLEFSPNALITRSQAVTFLYRATANAKASGTNKFADVKEDAYYYNAVLWAAANDITAGTGTNADGKAVFSPNTTCSRAEAVTFLYHLAGSPAVTGEAAFADVQKDDYYYDAVIWAAKNGITAGTGTDADGNALFTPSAKCTRAEMVTFLYKFSQLEEKAEK